MRNYFGTALPLDDYLGYAIGDAVSSAISDAHGDAHCIPYTYCPACYPDAYRTSDAVTKCDPHTCRDDHRSLSSGTADDWHGMDRPQSRSGR